MVRVSFIIDGRKLKSINYRFNMGRAKLQSARDRQRYSHETRRMFLLTRKRNRRVRDYMHKAARLIVDYALSNGIGTVIVG